MKRKKKVLGSCPPVKHKKGTPITGGEAWHVLSKNDTREHYGRIVAVSGFPVVYGICAKVLAVGVSIEEIKGDLRILGRIKDRSVVLSAMIRPGLDVCCYLVVLKEPEVTRKKREE